LALHKSLALTEHGQNIFKRGIFLSYELLFYGLYFSSVRFPYVEPIVLFSARVICLSEKHKCPN